jgi:hypothetical protein
VIVRLAVLATAVVLLAGCGDSGTRADFEHHLQRDGRVLYHASSVLRPPPSKSISVWAAELQAARPRLHAAVVDLAAVKAPSDARADTKALLRGFRFADSLIARLARDTARRDRVAIVRDGSSLRPGSSQRIFGPFRAAVRDLRRKGYAVGVLSR